MTSQKLTKAVDHLAFQQRVKREVGANEEFTVQQKWQQKKAASQTPQKDKSGSNFWVTMADERTLARKDNPVLEEFVN